MLLGRVSEVHSPPVQYRSFPGLEESGYHPAGEVFVIALAAFFVSDFVTFGILYFS
jgi:hypothetical protein